MAKKKKVKRSKELDDHFAAVIALGPHPSVFRAFERLEIHHVHGGSVKEAGLHVGMAQKQNDWLVICLPKSLHTGNEGIDYGYGVLSWEQDFGSQMELLRWTADQLDVDVFEKAGVQVND